MALKFIKQTEDVRGKILWFIDGSLEIHLVEIKRGYARGGHYHRFESDHILISGNIKYYECDPSVDNSESVKNIHSISIIHTPSNYAHMIKALEDTVFIEIFPSPYEATVFEPYRKIVNEIKDTDLS